MTLYCCAIDSSFLFKQTNKTAHLRLDKDTFGEQISGTDTKDTQAIRPLLISIASVASDDDSKCLIEGLTEVSRYVHTICEK